MKIDLKNLSFLKSQKKFKKGGLSAGPNFFWYIILVTVFVLMIVASAYGIYAFIEESRVPLFEAVSVNTKNQIINKDRVDRSLGFFSERAKKSGIISSSPVPVVDPSL